MEVPEWDSQTHGTVQLGRGAEQSSVSSVGGGEVGHRQVFQRLWATPEDGDLIQIPGTSDIGGRQQLAGGGEELVSGKDGLEEDVVHH